MMSKRIGSWMLGLTMLFGTMAFTAPTPADAQVVVRVGPRPHHYYHHHHYYYRHGHRYWR